MLKINAEIALDFGTGAQELLVKIMHSRLKDVRQVCSTL
jgi:hypothetical protein